MFKGYFEKLKETRKEMFEISLGMKDMFDHAIACEDEKVVDEIIKDIKKIQKKCYRIIDRRHLNDYHGGTYRCYPGGEVDVYRPHTDKQNIVDYIDYFFINTVSSADEFNEKFFEVASFSSRGPSFNRFKPDLVAPSVDITSCGLNNDYVKLSGTSVATPMIAGMCALILEDNPLLNPVQVKNKILSLCKPICFNKNLEGLGYPSLKNKKLS